MMEESCALSRSTIICSDPVKSLEKLCAHVCVTVLADDKEHFATDFGELTLSRNERGMAKDGSLAEGESFF